MVVGTEVRLYFLIITKCVMMWSAGISPILPKVRYEVLKEAGCTSVYCGCFYRTGPDDLQAPLNQLYNAVLNCGIPLVPDLVKVFFGALDKGVRSAGGCTTAMTMVLIGMMFFRYVSAQHAGW